MEALRCGLESRRNRFLGWEALALLAVLRSGERRRFATGCLPRLVEELEGYGEIRGRDAELGFLKVRNDVDRHLGCFERREREGVGRQGRVGARAAQEFGLRLADQLEGGLEGFQGGAVGRPLMEAVDARAGDLSARLGFRILGCVVLVF